jgi:hypothetical protein
MSPLLPYQASQRKRIVSQNHLWSAKLMQAYNMSSSLSSGVEDLGLIVSKYSRHDGEISSVSLIIIFYRIKTVFAYIPHTKPEPPSVRRQLAYQGPSPLPGPESDPEGWKTLAPVHSHGLLLPNHPVNVKCTVSIEHLARPPS